MTDRTFIARSGLFFTILLTGFACTTPTAEGDKDDARDAAKTDDPTDYCELYMWYGDGECDEFCASPDPDCTGMCETDDDCAPVFCLREPCPANVCSDEGACELEAQCEPVTCRLACGPEGFALGEDGCEICSCAEPAPEPIACDEETPCPQPECTFREPCPPNDCGEDGFCAPREVSCEPVTCRIACGPEGFERDDDGCEICACARPEPMPEPEPDRISCDDENPCPQPECTFREPCPPNDCGEDGFCAPRDVSCEPVTCRIACGPMGFERDEDGCEICRCAR